MDIYFSDSKANVRIHLVNSMGKVRSGVVVNLLDLRSFFGQHFRLKIGHRVEKCDSLCQSYYYINVEP